VEPDTQEIPAPVVGVLEPPLPMQVHNREARVAPEFHQVSMGLQHLEVAVVAERVILEHSQVEVVAAETEALEPLEMQLPTPEAVVVLVEAEPQVETVALA
jgi:hypothetical protein